MNSLEESIPESEPMLSSDARSKVHMLAPFILTLPVDVLALIFAELAIPWHPALPENMPEPLDTGLRAVCRRWREVIDGTPTLWTSIYLNKRITDLKRLRVVLARSKKAPLDLTVNIKAMEDRVYSVVLSEVPRVRSLTLQCDTRSLRSGQRENAPRLAVLMQWLLQRKAPLLQGLKISNMVNIPPDIFFNVTPPRLSYVFLDDCVNLPPSCCIFRSKNTSLTDLVVHGSRIWSSAANMLTILGGLPNLRRFVWESSDMLEGFNPQNEPRSTHLSRLERLCLRLPAELAARFLFYVALPASAEMVVHCKFDTSTPRSYLDFLQLQERLDAHLRPYFLEVFPHETSGYSSVTVQRSTHDNFGWAFNVVLAHPVNASISPSSTFSYDFSAWRDNRGPLYYDELESGLTAQMLAWAGRNATSLHMCCSRFMRKKYHWGSVLRALPCLASIDVSGLPALALFCTLQPGWWHPDDSDLTPALETIRVGRAGAETIAHLIKTLDGRVKAGRRKLKLDFHDIRQVGRNGMPAVVARLEKHGGVEQVTWDGKNWRPHPLVRISVISVILAIILSFYYFLSCRNFVIATSLFIAWLALTIYIGPNRAANV